MAERSVSVRLRMVARDYIAEANAAGAATDRLAAKMRGVGDDSRKASEGLKRAGEEAERSAGSLTKGLRATAISLGVLGAAGGAVKLLPEALTAAGAAAATLPGIMGGAAAGMGVFKVATIGVSDAVSELFKTDDPFARLSPSAKTLVNEIGALKPQLLSMQQTLSDRALAGAAGNLDRVAAVTLPRLAASANMLADDWSIAFQEIANAATDPQVLGSLDVMAASADRFFDQMTTRIQPLARTFASITQAADPAVRAIGDQLVSAIDTFVASVEAARRSGSLAEFFAAGADNARAMVSIASDLVRIFGQVAGAATLQNTTLQDAAAALDSYVNSGRSAADMTGIVNTLTAAFDGLLQALAPIASVARDALADPAMMQSMQTFFQILSAGTTVLAEFARLFLELNEATGGFLGAAVAAGLLAGKVSTAVSLLGVSAGKASTKLGALGPAGAAAGRGLSGLAGAAGEVGLAFVGLQLAHQVFASFDDSAANVDRLDASIRDLAKSGKIAGEMTRVFNKGWGDIAVQAKMATADNWFANFLRNGEKALPIAGDLAKMLGSPTFVQSADNFATLDTELAKYISTTKDAEGASTAWNQILSQTGLNTGQLIKLLPSAWAQLQQVNSAANGLTNGMTAGAARAKLLGASMTEVVTASRNLLDVFNQLNGPAINFAEAQIKADQAVDKLNEALDNNGKALNKSGTDFNRHTEAGQQNKQMTLDVAKAAADAAEKRRLETGSVEKAAVVYDQYINQLRASLAAHHLAPALIDAIIAKYAQMPAALQEAAAATTELSNRLNSIPKGTKFRFDGTSLVDGEGHTIELSNKLHGLPQGKTFTWNGHSLVDGKGKALDLKTAINSIPSSKAFNIRAITGDADYKIRAIRASLAGLSGKTITIRAVADLPPGISIGALTHSRWGNVMTAMAAGGMLSAGIYPASNPPLVKFAEPETGGEAYVPRKGDPARSKSILSEAASWYGMRVTPMAFGGVMAAATGLVNVAAAGAVNPRATRLDSAEAYIRARDAVTSLNQSLKDNGRSFAVSTAKGRENVSAVYAVITAAQEAAKTKFDETGSVRAANTAYDAHIIRLRRTLAQQKINAATIRGLLSVASRPTYDVAGRAPSNSLANIAFAKSSIAAAGGIEDLRDKLSLNRASVNPNMPEGRDNVLAILGFLEQASSAAQDRFTQSGSSGKATSLYNGYISQLRAALKANGYSQATINALIAQYGRITLQPNATGGVYMAAAGMASLRQPQVFPTGQTMYGFAEPGTGGEMFLPRYGDQQRGRDLLSVGAGWYGGTVNYGGARGGDTTNHYNTILQVTPLTANLSMTELEGLVRQIDAKNRIGRRH